MMELNSGRILRPVLTMLLFAALFALALNRDFYTSSMASLYLSLAIFSALIVLVILRQSQSGSGRDLLWVVTGALVLGGIDYGVMKFQLSYMTALSFVGMAALAVLGTHAIWARAEDRKLLVYGFVPSVLFVASEYMASTLLDITEKLHPKTFDLFLYSFDCSLHAQFSFWMGQLFAKHSWLNWSCFLIYLALPLPLALVYAAQLKRNTDSAVQTMLAFLLTGPIGVVFYNILPACGPVHVFRNFPWYPLTTVAARQMPLIPIVMSGARNAIPSLHMTWVLLVWWNSRGLPRWIRAIAMAFAIFTGMATLGTGEHYFIDLVVAFPFSLMVQAACSYSLPFGSGERRNAFLFGALATLLWFAALSFYTRIFWISPVLPWTMIVVTVVPSILQWHRLLEAKPQGRPARLVVVGASA
jgi:hypothetical protein